MSTVEPAKQPASAVGLPPTESTAPTAAEAAPLPPPAQIEPTAVVARPRNQLWWPPLLSSMSAAGSLVAACAALYVTVGSRDAARDSAAAARMNAENSTEMRKYFEGERRIGSMPRLTVSRGEPQDGGAIDTLVIENRGDAPAASVAVRVSASIFELEGNVFRSGNAITDLSAASVIELLRPHERSTIDILTLAPAATYCQYSAVRCRIFLFVRVSASHASSGARVSTTDVFLVDGARITSSHFAGGLYEDGGLVVDPAWEAAVPTMAQWFKVIAESDAQSDSVFYPTEPFSNLGLDQAAKHLVRRADADAGLDR